jgi:hypothetical protein
MPHNSHVPRRLLPRHLPLPDLIHYASLRLGVNFQNPKAWLLKVVDHSSSVSDPEIIAYARYMLPAFLLAKLEQKSPRRRLGDEEKARYEREAEEGSDGVGMPKGINVPLLEVVGPVMAKARGAFPNGGREGISEFFGGLRFFELVLRLWCRRRGGFLLFLFLFLLWKPGFSPSGIHSAHTVVMEW